MSLQNRLKKLTEPKKPLSSFLLRGTPKAEIAWVLLGGSVRRWALSEAWERRGSNWAEPAEAPKARFELQPAPEPVRSLALEPEGDDRDAASYRPIAALAEAISSPRVGQSSTPASTN